MTDEDRDRIRAKQDRVIALVERHHINEDLAISTHYVGSPTTRQLRTLLWDAWEPAIDSAISYLEALSR